MAVDIIPRTYEGRQYTFYKGIDTNGEYGPVGGFVEFIEEGEKYGANLLTGRFFPDYKHIQHDTGKGNGNLSWIKTYYQHAYFDNDGVMMTTPKKNHPVHGTLMVWTNDADEDSFTMQFGPHVATFDINGVARCMFGHNNYPIINTNPARTDVPYGAVIPETPESMNSAPTRDYRQVALPTPPPTEPA